MTRLVWIVLRRVYLLPALLVAAATFAYTWEQFDRRYGTWIQTSETAHSALLLAGPILIGAGGYAALRLTSNAGLFAQSSAVRHGGGMVGLHLGTGLVTLGGAFVLGIAPLFVWTATNATWGRPLLLPLLNALVSVAACLALGYAVCRLLPSPALPPILAVSAFWALGGAAGVGHDGWNMLTPVRFRQYDELAQNNLVAMGFQVLLYTLIAVSAISALALASRGTGRRSRWRWVAPALVVTAPFTLIPVGVLLAPPLFVPTKSLPTLVCAPTSTVPLCLHPIMHRDLKVAADTVDDLVALYGGRLPSDVERFVNVDDPRLTGPGDLLVTVDPYVPLRERVISSLSLKLSGVERCHARFDQRTDRLGNPVRVEQADVADAVWAWLDRHSEGGFEGTPVTGERAKRVFEQLEALPEPAVSAWLAAHRERLFDCDVPISEVP